MLQETSGSIHLADSSRIRFIFRALIVGSVLIILNCYWIVSAENRVGVGIDRLFHFPHGAVHPFSCGACQPIVETLL